MKKLIYCFYVFLGIIGILSIAFGCIMLLVVNEARWTSFVFLIPGILLCIPWLKNRKNRKIIFASKEKSSSINSDVDSLPASTPDPAPARERKSEEAEIRIPRVLGSAWLHYHYTLPFVLENLDLALSMNEASDFSLYYEIADDRVVLLHNNEVLGHTTERLKMFKDWKKHNNPLLLYLYKVDEDAGVYEIFVAFYEDERKRQSWREQTVFALTNYKSEEVQLNLLWAATEKTIAVDIDTDDDGHYCVYNDGALLGRVPTKYSDRFEEEYYTLAVIESLDMDDDTKYIPVIRVYW